MPTISIARVANSGLVNGVDLTMILFFLWGALRWMSPEHEQLDPTHFGSKGCPTREPDCHTLGMVVYR